MVFPSRVAFEATSARQCAREPALPMVTGYAIETVGNLRAEGDGNRVGVAHGEIPCLAGVGWLHAHSTYPLAPLEFDIFNAFHRHGLSTGALADILFPSAD